MAGQQTEKAGAEKVPMTTIEDAKSSVNRFELPAGIFDEVNKILYDHVTLEEMTGEEEDVMASNNIGVDVRLNIVLTNCTRELSSKDGAHVIKDKAKLKEIITGKMLSGDRLFMLVSLRRISLGDDILFDVICPHVIGEDKKTGEPVVCREPQAVRVNLAELKVTYLPDKKIRFYMEELPSGKKVKIKYSAGEDENVLNDALESKENLLSQILLARIAEIDGVQVGIADIKKLKVRDRNYLRNRLKNQNPGIERTLEITCKKCKHEWVTSIGLESASFFFPGEPTA